VLIILEVSLIASRYSLNFDEYISIVIIILAFPLAYFGYHYLSITYKEARDEQRFSGENYRAVDPSPEELTYREIEKLTESSAYKEYEKSKYKGQSEDHE
jgi:hypothetical protein